MVRLRTDRWYGADGQRRSRARVGQHVSGTRRLLSLCFLLALVIVLMQQAADPGHVRHAFQALGVPLDETPATAQSDLQPSLPSLGSTAASASAMPTVGAAPSAWDVTCRDVVGRLLHPLSDPDITELAGTWFTVSLASAGQSVTENSADPVSERSAITVGQAALPALPAVHELIATLVQETTQSTISEAEKTAWLARLRDFESQWDALRDGALGNGALRDESQPPPGLTSISPELQSALTAYFDQRLMAVLRDATPWTKSETIPFWRLLQRGAEGRVGESTNRLLPSQRSASLSTSVQPPRVNTLQLAATADELRGSLIRFSGSVRRVELSERIHTRFGLNSGYAILWLRGSDQAVQPVAVYTTDRRAQELAQQLDPNSLDFPEIEVEAIFAKRLAYASESGVQVAPALFATRLNLREPRPAPLVDAQPAKLWNQFLVALLLAGLLSAAILRPIYVQYRQRTQHNNSTRRSPRQSVNSAVAPEQSPVRKGRVSGLVLMCMFAMSALPLRLPTQAQTHSGPTNTHTFSTDEKQPLEPLAQLPSATPPWAAAATTDPVLTLYVDSLQKIFDPVSAQQLADFSRQSTGPFPDSVLKVLYATRRVGWKRAEMLTQPVALSDQLQLRSERVSGWVRLASPVALSEGQLSWFQGARNEQLYRLEVQLTSAGQVLAEETVARLAPAPADSRMLTIYCQKVPKIWLSAPQLRQPARFDLLTISTTQNTPAALCGLAESPQWLLPADLSAAQQQSELQPVLPNHLRTLGEQGWDLMHLDTISQHSQQKLSSEEAAGFYSLLRIVGNERLKSGDGASGTNSPLELLARAQDSIGQAVHWPVRIVSATVVDVTDTAHREQLGADSYVQYDGFVEIGNDRIRFQPARSAAGAADLEFHGEFPVTIVSPRAASGLKDPAKARGARSWSVGKYTEVHGRFYRLWSYQSELVRTTGEQSRQIAPLLMAAHIETTAAPLRHTSREVGWFGVALCGAVLVILAGILRLAMSQNRRRAG
jgi:hypothetical protein